MVDRKCVNNGHDKMQFRYILLISEVDVFIDIKFRFTFVGPSINIRFVDTDIN